MRSAPPLGYGLRRGLRYIINREVLREYYENGVIWVEFWDVVRFFYAGMVGLDWRGWGCQNQDLLDFGILGMGFFGCQNQDLLDFGILGMGFFGVVVRIRIYWIWGDFWDGVFGVVVRIRIYRIWGILGMGVFGVVVRIRIYWILGFSGWGFWGGCQDQDLPDLGGFWGWGFWVVRGLGGGGWAMVRCVGWGWGWAALGAFARMGVQWGWRRIRIREKG